MLNRHQAFGKTGEAMAVRHLKKSGYKILERNFRNSMGEIDIVARHRGVLVFVEVKARRTDRYGSPKFAVTAAKQRKISMVALSYLKATGQRHTSARFDVVTVTADSEKPSIDIIENAFELAYT